VLDWLLAAAAILLPLDVAARRVQLDPAAIWAWLRRRREAPPPTATMDALLRRVRSGEAPAPAAPRPPAAPPRPAGPAPRPAAPVRPAAPPPPPAGGSTASRLLEAKRRRQQPPTEDQP
jgi:hypothetical protein